MIFLYTVSLMLLGLVRAVVSRRANSLANRYSKVADKVALLMQESLYKPGNSGTHKNDLWAVNAKRQYELGCLVSQRDRLEAKYLAWQHRADRLGQMQNRVLSWKGQKLPYTLGALDVWLALYLVDRFGAGDVVNPQHLISLIANWIST